MIVLVRSSCAGRCCGGRGGPAVRRLVHVLEPGGHCRGLRAASAPGRIDAACCCSAGPRSPRSGGLCWFLAVYAARVRQPPVDDPAAAGLHGVPAFLQRPAAGGRCCRARRPGRGGGMCRARRTSVRVEFLGSLAARWFRRPAFADALRTFWFDVTKSDWRETMVLEVPAADGERTAAHVRVRSRAAVRVGAAIGGRGGARAPGADELAARRASRPDLRRRRSHSLWATTSATPTSSSCPRTSSWRFWRRSASSPGSVPSGRDSRPLVPVAFLALACVEHRGQLSGARQERGSAADGGPDGDDGRPLRTERAAHDRHELAAAERPHVLRSVRAA